MTEDALNSLVSTLLQNGAWGILCAFLYTAWKRESDERIELYKRLIEEMKWTMEVIRMSNQSARREYVEDQTRPVRRSEPPAPG